MQKIDAKQIISNNNKKEETGGLSTFYLIFNNFLQELLFYNFQI